MCWFCDGVKKFVNKNIVVYDDTAVSTDKEYCHIYSKDTVTLKITAGGYRGNSNILTGMRALNGLKYCPNCGEKIEDFDDCASKENDKISCEIGKLKRDVEDLKKDLDNALIGDRDLLTESYIENKRKLYEMLKEDRRWTKDQLDNCSFNFYDVDIDLAALRRIDKKISEIESSKIFKYIKEELIMAKKYREKPCNEVEAFQWDGENIDIAHYFIEKQYHHEVSVICGRLWVKNSKNTVIAKKGDYIVKGVDGEFYVCERDVFEKMYEEVKEPKIIMVGMLQNIANLYERLAKDGIECSMTVDDKNSICTIYCHGVELEDNSERINKLFEDVLEEEEENDQ